MIKINERQMAARKRNWELRCLAGTFALYTNLLRKYKVTDANKDVLRNVIHSRINVKYGFDQMLGIKKVEFPPFKEDITNDESKS